MLDGSSHKLSEFLNKFLRNKSIFLLKYICCCLFVVLRNYITVVILLCRKNAAREAGNILDKSAVRAYNDANFSMKLGNSYAGSDRNRKLILRERNRIILAGIKHGHRSSNEANLDQN